MPAGKRINAVTDASEAHAGTAAAALADTMLRTEILAALNALGGKVNDLFAELRESGLMDR
jgi:hypothetical protein